MSLFVSQANTWCPVLSNDETWQQTAMRRSGLVVVDVFANWAGPCTAMAPSLKRLFFELTDKQLHFFSANADKISALSKFRGKSRPVYLFIKDGRVAFIQVGVNLPKIVNYITENAPSKALYDSDSIAVFDDADHAKNAARPITPPPELTAAPAAGKKPSTTAPPPKPAKKKAVEKVQSAFGFTTHPIENPLPPNPSCRILVVQGAPGAGKVQLASRLSETYGMPMVSPADLKGLSPEEAVRVIKEAGDRAGSKSPGGGLPAVVVGFPRTQEDVDAAKEVLFAEGADVEVLVLELTLEDEVALSKFTAKNPTATQADIDAHVEILRGEEALRNSFSSLASTTKKSSVDSSNREDAYSFSKEFVERSVFRLVLVIAPPGSGAVTFSTTLSHRFHLKNLLPLRSRPTGEEPPPSDPSGEGVAGDGATVGGDGSLSLSSSSPLSLAEIIQDLHTRMVNTVRETGTTGFVLSKIGQNLEEYSKIQENLLWGIGKPFILRRIIVIDSDADFIFHHLRERGERGVEREHVVERVESWREKCEMVAKEVNSLSLTTVVSLRAVGDAAGSLSLPHSRKGGESSLSPSMVEAMETAAEALRHSGFIDSERDKLSLSLSPSKAAGNEESVTDRPRVVSAPADEEKNIPNSTSDQDKTETEKKNIPNSTSDQERAPEAAKERDTEAEREREATEADEKKNIPNSTSDQDQENIPEPTSTSQKTSVDHSISHKKPSLSPLTREIITLSLSLSHVESRDLIGKSDPYLVISKISNSTVMGNFPIKKKEEIYRSETVENAQECTFKEFTIPTDMLVPDGDPDDGIFIELFDSDKGDDDLIGRASTNLRSLSTGVSLSLLDPNNHDTPSALLTIISLKRERERVPMIYFVLGGPGSGKGTQCAILVKEREREGERELVHLSAGDLLRDEVRSGSLLGETINKIIEEGKLVPQEVTISLIKKAIDEREREREREIASDLPSQASEKDDSKESKDLEERQEGESKRERKRERAYLIDGFPRALDQAREFERRVGQCVFCLFFDCPDEKELERRLLKRGLTSGRSDDNAESIKKRFATYMEQTMPVIEHFRSLDKLVTVDATREIEIVTRDTLSHF